MNKMSGKKSDFALMSEDASRVVIGYGLKKVTGKTLYEWYETSFYKKQTSSIGFQDVKQAIITDINNRITEQIVGGMTWEEKPVWLSIENQINFSQATAPCRIKIGEEEDSTPVYHDFETAADLKAFVDSCLAWKNQCLDAGRAEKEGIDWSAYEALFPKQESQE